MARILVVEDSPTQAEELRLVLETEGHAVEVATDGKAGLDRFHASAPDLVITDIVMPRLSGYDLCRRIKADARGRETPVILLTTLKDPMDIIEGLVLGADNFLTKPYEPDHLLARVRNILANERLRRDAKVRVGVEIEILGRRVTVTTEKEQILSLLVSTFEEFLRARAQLEEYARRLAGGLRESEERFRRLVENSTDLIYRYRLEPTRGFDYVSPAVTAITGYTPEEHYADPDLGSRIVHPDDRPRLEAILRDPAAAQGPVTLRWFRKDGTVVWTEQRIVLVRDEAGDPQAIEGIARDVTERVRAEEALRKAEARFAQFLENMPFAGLFVVDAGGHPLYANTRAVELLGIRADPTQRVGDPASVSPVYRAGTDERYPVEEGALVRALRGETTVLGDVEVRPEGRRIQLEVWGCPILDSTGRIAYAMAAFHDITDRRKLEVQLRQAQKMEAVGRLAGGVAHDFNNILTGIIGYSDLLLRRLSPLDPLRPDLEEIRKLGDRAAGLTRQLLSFSRQQVLQPRVLDPNAVVGGMEKMLRRLIGEDVDLRFVLAAELGRIKADPGGVEQVVMNLAVNARDAMPSGGKLTIETANADLDEGYAGAHPGARAGRHVLIAVTDTGTGMDAETLAHLFEPFFTTKAPGKGTGLGLSTVYGIVKQTGGHMAVYSEPDHGSTFKVYLPRVDEPAEAAEPASATRPELRGTETVLVVEDEAGLREIARRILSMAGYRVLEAVNGREALVLAVQHEGPIHLVMTDVVMPEMGGPDLVRKLRFARPETRVLLTSGYTAHGALQNGILEAGAAFLMKPFAPDALLRRVREVLDAPASRTG